MQNKIIPVIFFSLFSFIITATGQKLVNSPYSRFNIGSFEPAGSFKSLGMGGIGVSMRGNNSIYFSNPASYSSLDTNSFLFDFGIDYGRNYLSDGVSTYTSDDINFNHLVIGFPISKGWGFAAGIVPLTNGYYKLAETVLEGDPDYDPITGEYSLYHGGEGGFSNFFLGTGIKINKKISAGVNMKLLFGQLKRTNQFDFADYYNAFNNNSTEKLQLGGINFDYGIQYTTSFKNEYFFNAGVSISSGKYYKTKYEHIAFRYTAYNTQDTISYVANDSSRAYIPGTLKLGISFGKKDKFTAGIDYLYTKWSGSKIPGSVGYAADTKSILFGAEYIPEKYSNYSYFKRLEYRIGGHVADNYLILNGEQIKEFGGSIGLGIPMRRLSKINMYFDLTRKSGSIINGLHSENYYTFGLSLNLYDFWFIKRKYD